MRHGATVAAVIPALNEAPAIGRVIAAIPPWVDRVVVADNGSTDGTAKIARAMGARVVCEPRRGYGAACQAGIRAAGRRDVIVFLDGDFADDPGRMAALVDPIAAGEADLVLGSRVRGGAEPGALTLPQRFGNALACWLMRRLWGARYTDLGPFRAIRRPALARLEMRDMDFGWTVEMQVKALVAGLAVREVPTAYRRRIGRSKISGTLRGTVAAGVKILSVIVRAALTRRAGPASGAR
ncbi:MAG: glycosyltransferase family 2 protein [Pseudomonadota bacterium]